MRKEALTDTLCSESSSSETTTNAACPESPLQRGKSGLTKFSISAAESQKTYRHLQQGEASASKAVEMDSNSTAQQFIVTQDNIFNSVQLLYL